MTEPAEYDIGRLFDAYAETHARRAGAVSNEQGLGAVAFAALALAVGCPGHRVGDLWHRMMGKSLPADAQQAVTQFAAEVDQMLRHIGQPRGDQP